jgi:uncharacterized protein (DUF169 family)
MNSKIAEAISMKYKPVAIIWSDEKPEEAMQFKPGRWGCVMFLLAGAAKGKTAVADVETFGCIGGGVGLGFGNQYVKFPAGIENYISTGNPEFCRTEIGRQIVQQMPEIEQGERYVKDPETAKRFIDQLPIIEAPAKYVVLKPLDMVKKNETPRVVVFCVHPDQLSALIVLANYARAGSINVIAPFGAGCHQIGIIPYREAESETPRAIIGLTDISARKSIMKMLDHNVLSFTVPYKMFLEMEGHVEGSFLQKESWRTVMEHQREQAESD